jgi:hypothetical protein
MPLYAYECEDQHRTEEFRALADWSVTTKCRCGRDATLVIQPVAIHTIASFSADIMDEDVKRLRSGDGSYVDPTLSFEPGTNRFLGEITSHGDRQRRLKERGLFEKEPSDKAREVQRDKRRKAKSFSATGTRA